VLVIADGPTNRRRVGAHSTLIRSAFVSDGRTVLSWLRKPGGSASGVIFFSDSTARGARSQFGPRRRVRRRGLGVIRAWMGRANKSSTPKYCATSTTAGI
jgi:hypothetical protein